MLKYDWTSEIDALLGTDTDIAVSELVDIPHASIIWRRRKLGIPSFGPTGHPLEWSSEVDALLGESSDRRIAAILGISDQTVRNRRHELGISSYREQNRVVPRELESKSREAANIYARRRRHRELGLEDTFTYEQWKFACKYFNHKCAYCCEKAWILTEDHLTPVSKGGPRTALNIIPACTSCNCSKNTQRAHLWIYKKFGMQQGKVIIDRIVAYLAEVQDNG